ncbi:MAG: ribosome maturation factor RimP, partial [Coprobacillus sp.]
KVTMAIGEYVYVQLAKPAAGIDELYGTILNVEGEKIEIQYLVKNIKKKCIIDYDNIAFIRLAVQF